MGVCKILVSILLYQNRQLKFRLLYRGLSSGSWRIPAETVSGSGLFDKK